MTWYLGFALKYFSKEKIRMDKANAENLDNCQIGGNGDTVIRYTNLSTCQYICKFLCFTKKATLTSLYYT